MAEMPAEAELEPESVQYMTAFNMLSPGRQLGVMGGEGPIPFQAIDAYATRYCIDDPDEFERFSRLIRSMDHEYLTIRAEQARQEPAEASNKP